MLLFLYCILTLAIVFDFIGYKIPNKIILMGLITGAICRFISDGVYGVLFGIRDMLIIFALGMILYILQTMGAGDIKLFLIISVFTGYLSTIQIMITSLFVGLIIGILEILFKQIFKVMDVRMRLNGKFANKLRRKLDEEKTVEEKKNEKLLSIYKKTELCASHPFFENIRIKKMHYIHFSFAVLPSALLVLSVSDFAAVMEIF